MKPVRLAGLLVIALALAAPVAAALFELSPTQSLVFAGDRPTTLRALLRAHADSLEAAHPLESGEAWATISESYARAAIVDSAIAAARKAQSLRGNIEDALALADRLIARGTRQDAREALEALAGAEGELGFDPGPRGIAVRLRAAWCTALAGDTTGACERILSRPADLLAPRVPIPARDLWLERFAPLLLAGGHAAEAAPLLRALAVRSRGADASLLRLARTSAAGSGDSHGFAAALAAAIARDDTAARASLGAVAPRIATVRAEDGAALRAWLVPARPLAPMAIVVIDPESPAPGAADSLVVQLHRAGIAVALLDPRGSRGSASAAYALPSRWSGHEDAFHARLARDVSAAIAPCARAMGALPTRVCVVADGPLALAGALAAQREPRIRAVVLAGASIAATDRGRVVAALRASGVSTFIQQGPEDLHGNEVTDRIAQLVDPHRVRVADTESAGRGVMLFRAGPAAGRRLSDWLRDLPSAPRATPPARRR